MSYTACNTQTGERTGTSYNATRVLHWAEDKGWEDCEVEIMEWVRVGAESLTLAPAEFPCTYAFHYGEDFHTCELTANRPDSYCEVHGGE